MEIKSGLNPVEGKTKYCLIYCGEACDCMLNDDPELQKMMNRSKPDFDFPQELVLGNWKQR